jgi:hypothetical protein
MAAQAMESPGIRVRLLSTIRRRSGNKLDTVLSLMLGGGGGLVTFGQYNGNGPWDQRGSSYFNT